MIIPTKIKIGIYIYKIIRDYDFKNKTTWGETNFKDLTIKLAKKLRGKVLEQTFLHEVRHIIANIYNGIEANTAEDEKENERMSQGWYQVLEENNMLK